MIIKILLCCVILGSVIVTLKLLSHLLVMTMVHRALHDITDHRCDNLFFYISVFVCLISTTFWEYAYVRMQDYPNYAVCDFLEFGCRLGWIIPVHFCRIKLLPITRKLQTFSWQWILISPQNLTMVQLLAPLLAILSHVPL